MTQRLLESSGYRLSYRFTEVRRLDHVNLT
jgi:hypothetical protein